ncbi:MAG: nuclear transport factor 2 family protein [Rhodocyclaceae bacterium]|nr:nuclear transport factor 2 family protein [Rhodocyclaceae bacterium]
MSKTVFTTPQEVEDAFYEAFARADLDAMMAVWSEDDEVMCVHPGAPRVVGLAAVRDSWQQLFSNGARLEISISHPVESTGTMIAIHSVLEHVQIKGDSDLHSPIVATNVFMRGPLGWRMVAHHASPTPEMSPHSDPNAPLIVH